MDNNTRINSVFHIFKTVNPLCPTLYLLFFFYLAYSLSSPLKGAENFVLFTAVFQFPKQYWTFYKYLSNEWMNWIECIYSAVANTSIFNIQRQEQPNESILLLFHFRKGNDDSIWSLGRKIWSNVFIKINCPPNGQDIFSTCPVLEI